MRGHLNHHAFFHLPAFGSIASLILLKVAATLLSTQSFQPAAHAYSVLIVVSASADGV
jgi:hypothetical protein